MVAFALATAASGLLWRHALLPLVLAPVATAIPSFSLSPTPSRARYHSGHPASHVTRLLRSDHSGLPALLEAEARWQRVGREPAPSSLIEGAISAEAPPPRFVPLSQRQVEGLQEHHRAWLQTSTRARARAANGGKDVAAGTGGRDDGAALAQQVRRHSGSPTPLPEEHPVGTSLSSLDSQYVGHIGVGTVSTCREAQSSSLVNIAKGPATGAAVPAHSVAQVGVRRTCRTSSQQTVQVVFDTGSTNMWISSDLCTEGPCAKPGRHRYNHTVSTTYRDPSTMANLRIVFGTGVIKGHLGVDDVSVGPFTVYNQTFGLIQTEEGHVFEDVPFEGILGLAFPTMSAMGVRPFFDTIVQQKAMSHNEFAFYFSLDDPAANAVLWGGVDPAFHKGPIEYFRVLDPFYWSVKLLSFKIGNDTLMGGDGALPSALAEGADAGSQGFARAIVDTGTTFFTAEDALFNKVMERLAARPCDKITSASHPPISYRLEAADGTPRDFVLSNSQYMTKSSRDDSSCFPAFMKIDIPAKHGPAMVLGEVFLRHYFSVFDRGDGDISKARIGLAASNHDRAASRRLKDLTQEQPEFRVGKDGVSTPAAKHHALVQESQGGASKSPSVRWHLGGKTAMRRGRGRTTAEQAYA